MAIVSVPKTASPILIFYMTITIFSPIMASSPNSEAEALLKLKNSFTNKDSLASWEPGSEPCAKAKTWVGLVCRKGKVSGIHLTKMGLSGKIDVDALDQLPGLRTISFEDNSFTGPMPQLNRIGTLKGLYMSGNQFSGEIPKDFFQTMNSIKKINLSGNKFTGEIPSSLSQLTHLMVLHLENNQFSGSIPPLEQKTLISLDLSNNKLDGEIPPSLSKFNATSFQGNAGLCGEKIGKECDKEAAPATQAPPIAPPASYHEEAGSSGIAYGLMSASAIILGIMMAGILIMRRRQDKFDVLEKECLDDSVNVRMSKRGGSSTRGGSRRGSSHGSRGSGDLVMVNDEKGFFGMTDLMKAAAEVLGNGSLGSSYKAMMPNGFSVVVKRTQQMNKLGRDGFETEITRFARLKHQNILTPLAYHYRKEEKLLVFEHISKGSLLFLLHGDRGQSHADLNWPVRLNIIKGIAQGLGYLHTELSSLEVPHGDLKSSNVLLTRNYEPLLADFGFSALLNNNQAANVLFAYKCPEVAQHRYVSPKSDIYCLGIIILEVLTGKFPCQYLSNGKGGTDVVQWTRSAIREGREVELLDPDIASFKSGHGEMKRMLHIGAACTESNPDQRLEIREAIRRIEEIQIDDDGSGRRGNDNDSYAFEISSSSS